MSAELPETRTDYFLIWTTTGGGADLDTRVQCGYRTLANADRCIERIENWFRLHGVERDGDGYFAYAEGRPRRGQLQLLFETQFSMDISIDYTGIKFYVNRVFCHD